MNARLSERLDAALLREVNDFALRTRQTTDAALADLLRQALRRHHAAAAVHARRRREAANMEGAA